MKGQLGHGILPASKDGLRGGVKMEDSHILDGKVKYKADDHVDQIHTNNLDPQANQIYLMGESDYILTREDGGTEEPGVEFKMASRLIKNVNILMRKNAGPILIHMKTCGGDYSEGMAIFDMLKACPAPITILNYTHARSMSSLIFQAANKRVMMKNSYFMFHDGTLGVGGTVKQVESAVEFNKLATNAMLDIYTQAMKRSGKFSKRSEAWIKKWLREQMDKKEDVYLTAEQTVELGLADEIFGASGKYDWGKLTEFTNEQLSRG
jgi:ATP-dependent Clp protease protease subunit